MTFSGCIRHGKEFAAGILDGNIVRCHIGVRVDKEKSDVTSFPSVVAIGDQVELDIRIILEASFAH